MKKSIIIEKLKEIKGLKNDGDIAKLLGLGKTSLAEHKRRGTVPYNKIVHFCLKEGISLDKVFTEEKAPAPGMVSESPAPPYGTAHFNEICKKLEKILSEGTVDEKAKILGIIEAVYNEIYVRKDAEQAAMREEDDARYKKTA